MENNTNTEVMEISDEELNISKNSNAINESVSSNGDLNSSLNSSQNSSQNSTKKRKLTKAEKEKLKIERELIKAEKEKQIKADKEKKAKEIQEKKELLEKERLQKQRIKDEEKEKRDKEKREKEAEKQRIKEEKEKERTEKLQLKEVEKQKKQEERDAQSEKKRKIEEEKQRKENEEKKRLEKSRQVLNRFFIKGENETNRQQKNILSDNNQKTNGLFLPFQLSANQTMAPIVHSSVKQRFVLSSFDSTIKSQDSNLLYLDLLKKSDYKPFVYTKAESSQPEIIIEENFDSNENERKVYKIKHLQFKENVRPPYRGTWNKKSPFITGRNPFHKDSQFFDYSVDSDEEWEEGGDGESLDGTDSDGSLKDDYEIDNEFFVPHGYLSPDENDENDEHNNSHINNDNDVHMIDDQLEGKETKSRPLLKEQVLMAERNRSFAKTLIPLVIGCVWESNTNQNNQKFVEILQSSKRVSIIHK